MDALRRDDLRAAQTTSPGVKLGQALDLMELGIAMQRRKLRAADLAASDEEIDARLLRWMSEPR